MSETRHIVRIGILSLILSLIAFPAWTEDAKLGGLHCGDVVTITATPDEGYRFVAWSDGNTDNPREIEITDAVTLSPVYAPACETEIVPVIMLYNELLMVNAEQLHQMGYTFSAQNVTWYRVVDDKQVIHEHSDDQVVSYGYYYTVPKADIGGFYAAVDVGQTPQSVLELCSDIIYSRVVWMGYSDIHAINAETDKEKIRKIIVNNQLYIVKGDCIYRADGSQVDSEQVKIERSNIVE